MRESVFKIGDVVTIREDLYPMQYIDLEQGDERYHIDGEMFTDDMMKFRGKIATIVDIDNDGEYLLDIDNGEWYWIHLMFKEGLNL